MIGGTSRQVLGQPGVQLEIAFARPKRRPKRKTHGGRRRNAGRKRSAAHCTLPPGKGYVPHLTRAEVKPRHPQHVTLRVVEDIANLRAMDLHAAVKRALRVAGAYPDFRVVHYSVQGDHIHLLVEADGKAALAARMKGYEVSLAKRINAVMTRRRRQRRRGRVLADRYHVRAITSVRGARNALSYILNNWRHHRERGNGLLDGRLDPYSSAILFPGWKEKRVPEIHIPPGYERPPVASPRSWLLVEGYKLAPPISCWEVPG